MTKFLAGIEFADGTVKGAPLKAETLDEAEKESYEVLLLGALSGEFAGMGDVVKVGIVDAVAAGYSDDINMECSGTIH
jgi:hypothetical protein